MEDITIIEVLPQLHRSSRKLSRKIPPAKRNKITGLRVRAAFVTTPSAGISKTQKDDRAQRMKGARARFVAANEKRHAFRKGCQSTPTFRFSTTQPKLMHAHPTLTMITIIRLITALFMLGVANLYSQSGSKVKLQEFSARDLYGIVVFADSTEAITRDAGGRAAQENVLSRFRSLAFDRKINVALATSYFNRTERNDILTAGRDNILFAFPSYSYRTVGTLIKKIEVTTTVVFSNLLTQEAVVKTETVTRNADWAQAFAEGLTDCLTQFLETQPSFNFYKTRAYKNSILESPNKEALLEQNKNNPEASGLEGSWEITNESHFGKFEIMMVQQKKPSSNEMHLVGYIVNPMFSGRSSQRIFLSLDLVEKDGLRGGIASEENLTLNYFVKARVKNETLVLELQDPFWRSLPNVVLSRPVGWQAHTTKKTDPERKVASRGSAKIDGDEEKASGRSSGSGFLVSRRGIIATNFHVIDGAKRLFVTLPEIGMRLEADVLAVDKRNDLALVQIRNFPTEKIAAKIPYYPQTTQNLQPGSKVFTIGYPLSTFLGNKPKFSDGSVSAITGPLDDPRLIQMNVSIQPGNSGGPLFSASGNLVGIVVASANARIFYEELGIFPQNINFAIKSDYLLSLLFSEKIRPDNEFESTATSLSMEELAERFNRFCAQISVEM